MGSKALLIRVVLGIGLVILGFSRLDRSWLFAGLCFVFGIGLGVPFNLGQTLIFDQSSKQVKLIQHRFPYLFQSPLVQVDLSEITAVHVTKQARQGFSPITGESIYQCDVLLELKSGETLLMGRYSDESEPGTTRQNPRELAEQTASRIRQFLKLRSDSLRKSS